MTTANARTNMIGKTIANTGIDINSIRYTRGFFSGEAGKSIWDFYCSRVGAYELGYLAYKEGIPKYLEKYALLASVALSDGASAQEVAALAYKKEAPKIMEIKTKKYIYRSRCGKIYCKKKGAKNDHSQNHL